MSFCIPLICLLIVNFVFWFKESSTLPFLTDICPCVILTYVSAIIIVFMYVYPCIHVQLSGTGRGCPLTAGMSLMIARCYGGITYWWSHGPNGLSLEKWCFFLFFITLSVEGIKPAHVWREYCRRVVNLGGHNLWTDRHQASLYYK